MSESAAAVETAVQPRVARFRVDVAMLGARLHYAVPRILDRAGQLGTFNTDFFLGNKPLLRGLLRLLPDSLAPAALQRLIGRDADLTSGRVVSFDAFGLRIAWLRRRARSSSHRLELHAQCNKEFCESVVERGLNGARAIYALNGAALEIFEEAKRRGILCILEQTIAPKQIDEQLAGEDAERWPGWEPGLTSGSGVNPLVEREEAEWALADRIICGSEFVAEGLRSMGVNPDKCQVVPYGIDTRSFRPAQGRAKSQGLNVLFVGAVGLRKGVPYLLEALRHLDRREVRCRLVGQVGIDRRRLAEYSRWAEVIGPVPRSQILQMFHWADAFVLPSICEGSATVTYEALACGLPVIATPNSGSIVRDGKEGFIVPIRDPEAIAQRVEQLLCDRELLSIMSLSALARSHDFDLAHYGQRLLDAIARIQISQ